VTVVALVGYACRKKMFGPAVIGKYL